MTGARLLRGALLLAAATTLAFAQFAATRRLTYDGSLTGLSRCGSVMQPLRYQDTLTRLGRSPFATNVVDPNAAFTTGVRNAGCDELRTRTRTEAIASGVVASALLAAVVWLDRRSRRRPAMPSEA